MPTKFVTTDLCNERSREITDLKRRVAHIDIKIWIILTILSAYIGPQILPLAKLALANIIP